MEAASIFTLDRVRPALIADGLGEAAVRYAEVLVVFCETRGLAEEWTYRFLGAAVVQHRRTDGSEQLVASLRRSRREVPPGEPTTAAVRAWAIANGFPVADRGRLRPEIWAAYRDAHQ